MVAKESSVATPRAYRRVHRPRVGDPISAAAPPEIGSPRDRFGRGLARVGQDNLRRIMLRERDRPGAANIGLTDLAARYTLDADRYGEMLAHLRAAGETASGAGVSTPGCQGVYSSGTAIRALLCCGACPVLRRKEAGHR
ncbi:hypothetical protein [Streptomyces sp. NPDC088246]|uniref:hypothetical protein n=1 Tax=Streptomyces sp. NPDC088246 TaxID=3365842 RepID=UPI00380C7A42